MRRMPRGGDREEGLTVVLATLMLAGMLVATLAAVQLHYVPVWEKDAEAADAALVDRLATDMAARLGLQTDDAGASLVLPLGLGTERTIPLGLGSNAPPARTVGFTPDDKPIALAAEKLLLKQDFPPGDGGGFGGENWVTIEGYDVVGDIGEIDTLRLRIEEVGKFHNGQSVVLNLTDAREGFAGNITVFQVGDPPSYTINVSVCNKNGCNGNNRLFDQGVAFHTSSTVAPFFVNLLHPDYRFDRVLDAAERPLTLNLTEKGFEAEYAVTFTRYSDGSVSGGPPTPPQSQVVDDWASDLDCGTLRLRNAPWHLPAQDYLVEHGALALRQADGADFRVEPSLAVVERGGATVVSATLPCLFGPAASSSAGAGSAVTASTVNATVIEGRATDLRLTLGTELAELWVDHLEGVRAASGLDAAQFTITPVAGGVEVHVLGTDPDPAAFDLDLRLRTAEILVDV